MHLSEHELARLLERGHVRLLGEALPEPPPVSEGVWQRAVMRVAVQAGWLAYHTYRSTKSMGGFPDLILAPGPTCQATPRVVYAVELKTDAGQVTAAQQAWLDALAGCTGVVAEVWRPSAFDEIVKRLRE